MYICIYIYIYEAFEPSSPPKRRCLIYALQANPACGLHSLGLDFTNVGPLGAARLATYLASRRCQAITASSSS